MSLPVRLFPSQNGWLRAVQRNAAIALRCTPFISLIVPMAASMRTGSVCASRRFVRRSRDPHRARAQPSPLECFLTRDVGVQLFEGRPVEPEAPELDPRDQVAPRPRLVEHLRGVLDPSSAHRDPVHQRLDLGEGERVALERHGVVHDLLERLARSEDCPRLVRLCRGVDSASSQCEAQPLYFHLRRLLPVATNACPVPFVALGHRAHCGSPISIDRIASRSMKRASAGGHRECGFRSMICRGVISTSR